MGFLLSTITCSEATPMAKACGVVLSFEIIKNQFLGGVHVARSTVNVKRRF